MGEEIDHPTLAAICRVRRSIKGHPIIDVYDVQNAPGNTGQWTVYEKHMYAKHQYGVDCENIALAMLVVFPEIGTQGAIT